MGSFPSRFPQTEQPSLPGNTSFPTHRGEWYGSGTLLRARRSPPLTRLSSLLKSRCLRHPWSFPRMEHCSPSHRGMASSSWTWRRIRQWPPTTIQGIGGGGLSCRFPPMERSWLQGLRMARSPCGRWPREPFPPPWRGIPKSRLCRFRPMGRSSLPGRRIIRSGCGT